MRPFPAAVALSASVALAVSAAAQEAFLVSEDAPESAAGVDTAWGHPDRPESEREDSAPPPRAQATFRAFRTVLVGPVPGDPLASGTRLLSALASINPASCPGDNWTLWIAPGVYDLGGASLVMKPCVDIEGAGERATKVTAAGNAAGGHCAAGTVMAASSTELRMLTIESATGGTTCALRADGASARLAQVTLLSGGSANAYGLSANNASSLSLTHVTIIASGGFVGAGIDADASALTLTDSTVVASGGAGDFAVSAQSSPLTIYRSRVAATTQTAIATDPGLARVAHSQLEGNLSPGIACIGNYDANLAPVTCP